MPYSQFTIDKVERDLKLSIILSYDNEILMFMKMINLMECI